MTDSRSVLFIIAQPGAAAYFAPLWRHWSRSPDAPDWRVAIDPISRRHAADSDIDAARIIDLEEVSEESAGGLMDRCNAGVVVTSTSFHVLERACLQLALATGRRGMQLIDAHYSYRHRIVDTNGPGLMPDDIIVPDAIAEAEAEADGLPADRLRPLGYPLWEGVAPAPPADERRALFVSQPIESDHGCELGYTQHRVLALALEAGVGPDGVFDEILLARHPRERGDALPDHSGVRPVASANEGMREAGTILGMYSSFLIEAVLAGRRTISLQPGAIGPDMCVLSRQRIIPLIEDAAGLRQAMAAPMPDTRVFRQAYAGSLERLDAFMRRALA